MDPRALLRPVGPLPVATYWRRRLVLLGAVVVLAVLLGSLTGGGGGRAGASTSGSTAHRSAAARPTAPAHRAATRPAPGAGVTASDAPVRLPIRACTARQVRLAVSTDHTAYPAGAEPRFVLAVTGAGTGPCTLDVGPGSRSFLVRSGADRIWSSADCAAAAHRVVTLRPHQRVAYSIAWSRHRSAPGCPSTATVAALPGTYRVIAKVGRFSSGQSVFTLPSG
ncbi:MAG: DUF4232 domain-containing protein [Frankiaceae bacterium]